MNIIRKKDKQINELKKEMAKQKKELMKQIELLLSKVGNTTINNIQINSYGNEDMSHITDKVKTDLLKIPYGAVPKLIEFVHFNSEKPENTNIKITNIRDNKISMYENGKWVFKNKKNAIKGIIDDKYYILDDYYNQLDEDKLSEFNHNNYKCFSEKYDSEDKDLMNKIYDDSEMIILNNQVEL
jgi:hypothetical protein